MTKLEKCKYSAVEYYVSYYDYFQPEAYILRTDIYIEKESQRNGEIERLRLDGNKCPL